MKKEEEEVVESSLPIVYADAYIIVVNKPAGLMVEPDRWGYPNVEDILAAEFVPRNAFTKRAQPIHRLDRPVSGLVVFARTPMAIKHLQEQFENRTVKKMYWAMVEGNTTRQAELTQYLMKDEANKKALVNIKQIKGYKEAILGYSKIKSLPKHSWLEVRPRTGRFHQIRAQLGSIGHPIVGDVFYGSKTIFKEKEILLHARYLKFAHPKTNELMEFEADLLPSFNWSTYTADAR